jgi:hypothetical protein
MKKLLLSLIFFLHFSITLNAQSNFILKSGINYSTFRNSDAYLKSGYTFGICKDWQIIKNVAIGSEINYTIRGGLFNDKPILSDMYFSPPYDVYSYDIHVAVGYLEIPVLVKYIFPVKNNIKVQLYAGLAVSLPLLDYSDTKNGKFLFYYDPDDPENDESIEDIEYYWMQDSGFYSKFNLDFVHNIGLGLNWSKLIFELRYSRANKEIGYVDMVSQVHKKSHAIHLLFGLCF